MMKAKFLTAISATQHGLLLIIVLCAVAASCGGNPSNASTGSQNQQKILAIAPVAQELSEWCWLASGQMVFQFFQIPAVNPNYQCGIIGAFYGPSSPCYYDCAQCDAGVGSPQNFTLMLQDYSYEATDGTEVLNSIFTPSQLTFQQVQNDINSNTPVIAGINPSSESVLFGVSQHVTVIVGYEIQNGQDYVVVNDPFPFALAGYPDPYLNAGAQSLQGGQYLVSYQTFVQTLLWNTAWDGLGLESPQPLLRERLEQHFGKHFDRPVDQ